MVNSGSSANLVMIAALKKYFGWVDGDEIIVSVCGFPTTLNPIIQNGLKPVFVDIDYSDLNWDLESIRKKLLQEPKHCFLRQYLLIHITMTLFLIFVMSLD